MSIEPTPLPKKTLFILSTVVNIFDICEPLSMTVLFPFVYYMVRDIKLSEDEKEIGFYVGFIASSFSIAQCCTSIFWGYLSDKFGRRPIILIGLIGNSLSMLSFGLSHSLAWAITSRVACGLLNGNIAVAKCVIGEVTDKSNQAKGFAYFGLAFGVGMILGPTIGGLFSNPYEKYPTIFGSIQFLQRNRYFLPCFLSAMIALFGFIIGLIYLPETSKTVLRKRQLLANINEQPLLANVEEDENFLQESDLNESCCTASSFDTITSHSRQISNASDININIEPTSSNSSCQQLNPQKKKLVGWMEVEALLCIINYALLAFFNIILDEVFSLWMLSPLEVGGLGYTSNDIGLCLSLMGIEGILAQIFVYPYLQRKTNTVTIYRICLIIYPIVFASIPLLTASAKTDFRGGTWYLLLFLSGVRNLCNVFGFTSIMLLINNSTTKYRLGFVNGVAQTSSAFVRSFGPALGGILWSWSLTSNLDFPFDYNFVFLFLTLIAILTTFHSFFIPKHIGEGREIDIEDED